MKKVLVYARRSWSFENLKPALEGLDYDVVCWEKGLPESFTPYGVIITCEPHIDGWKKFYPHCRGQRPIFAMQQSLFWTDTIEPKSEWLFDKMFCWGKMQIEMNDKHGLPLDKMILTGNPRYDKFFNIPITDKGYTLVLAGRRESIDQFPHFENTMLRPHPADLGYIFDEKGMEEDIRCASQVIARISGTGMIALIMKKPTMLLTVDNPIKTDGHLRYAKCKLYGKNRFGTDDEFVRYAVTDNQATKRVRKEILCFL